MLLFALVKLIPITLTLPGIAGMVLTLAVAADANIVMFERIKEEVRAGRSIPAAISTGYTKALSTIIDANVVTIGVAFILFTLATAGIKGFAFTLGDRHHRLAVHGRARHLGDPRHDGAQPRAAPPERARRGQGEHQRLALRLHGQARAGSSPSPGLILAAGAIAIASLGINFGIDFESGTRITTPLERPASVQDVRNTLDPLGYADAKIQEVDDPELGNNVIQIAVPQLEPDEVNKVEQALDADFGVQSDDFSARTRSARRSASRSPGRRSSR